MANKTVYVQGVGWRQVVRIEKNTVVLKGGQKVHRRLVKLVK